jgi:predicted enzyme related to lactoylglutathione lyase
MKPLANAPIGQIAMWMRDVATARDFYANVLGLSLLFEANGMCFFNVGGVRLMLGPVHAGHPGGNSILYFNVTELPGVHAQLVEARVKILQAPRVIAPLGARDLWMCEFADPEGNVLAAMEERARP